MTLRAWRAGAACLLAVVTCVAAPVPAVRAAQRYVDPTFAVDVRHDVLYGTGPGFGGLTATMLLDLYTPRGDTATNRPVFLFAHGGFFFRGDKTDADAVQWATDLAARGWVAASITYRMDDVPVTYPPTAHGLEQIDTARADMQTAVRWFRAHATELGIDPDRIAVGGSSAGAITALGVAVHADDPGPGDWAGESSAVCTAVSISGANDPAAIGPLDAGAIFFHGMTDTIVPATLAGSTHAAMVAAGLPAEIELFGDEGHLLSEASLAAAFARSVTWLYQRVVTAPYPCSPAVASQAGVAAGSSTVIHGQAGASTVMSVVAVDTTRAGYLQVLPCGAAPGAYANVNADAAGQIRSNLAIVHLDDHDGTACVYAQMRTHIVVDAQGRFTAGALDDVPDQRLLDTRLTGRPLAGSQTAIHGRPGSTGIVSLVAVDSSAPGYLQVLPCGAVPGGSANVNTDAAGQIRASLALVQFDAAGTACVYTYAATDVVVDLQAYLAPTAIDDVPDARLLDTRTSARPSAGSLTPIHGRPGATAVVSLVATGTSAPGYLQVLPCAEQPGAYANLTTDRAGETIGGLAFVQFDAQGTVCVFAQASTDVVVDLQGYLTPGAFVDTPDQRLLDTRPVG